MKSIAVFLGLVASLIMLAQGIAYIERPAGAFCLIAAGGFYLLTCKISKWTL